jgi:hypothetical protein
MKIKELIKPDLRISNNVKINAIVLFSLLLLIKAQKRKKDIYL